MKKFRLFLMSFAFLGAGAAVFATTLNQDDALVQYWVTDNAPCDTEVNNENCNGGNEMCKVSSGQYATLRIHSKETGQCVALFKQ